ncbi:MAG: hypothetical protein QF876_10790 [Desulfobacterales bacterium]|nr:hypothetical protein [Desulfobacterales bacterium]MDP6808667.1 hypothetical protein [Desulfobacterales bacterium]
MSHNILHCNDTTVCPIPDEDRIVKKAFCCNGTDHPDASAMSFSGRFSVKGDTSAHLVIRSGWWSSMSGFVRM